jgi:hypothetical protein
MGALRHNARMSAGHPTVRVLAPSVSPEEAAAIVAAIERFVRASAVPERERSGPEDRWRRTAILEGIAREPEGDLREPWINT